MANFTQTRPTWQHPKRGIVGLFWLMPFEHRRERVAAMQATGMPPDLIASLTDPRSNIVKLVRR